MPIPVNSVSDEITSSGGASLPTSVIAYADADVLVEQAVLGVWTALSNPADYTVTRDAVTNEVTVVLDSATSGEDYRVTNVAVVAQLTDYDLADYDPRTLTRDLDKIYLVLQRLDREQGLTDASIVDLQAQIDAIEVGEGGGGASFTDSAYTVYQSDVGNNANDGLTLDKPKATLFSALSAASALAALSGFRAVVVSDSAQTLTQDLTFPTKVSLVAPALRLVGNHFINDECLVDIYEAITADSTDNIFKKVGAGNSYVRMRQMDLRGPLADKTAVVGLFCDTGGAIWADIDRAVVSASSTLMRDGTSDSANGQVFYRGHEIVLAGNGAEAVRTRANGTLFTVGVGRIRIGGGATGTIAVGTNSGNTPTVRLAAQQIQAAVAWENLGTSSLYVDCPAISGTTGTGNAVVNGVVGVPINLASVSSPITVAAGSIVTATGNATGDKVFAVADGAFTNQITTIAIVGDPNDNTLSVTDTSTTVFDSLNAATAVQMAWNGTQWIKAGAYSTEGQPGALSLLDQISLAQINATDFTDGKVLGLSGTNLVGLDLSGGLSATTESTVAVAENTTITKNLHGIQEPSGSNLERRKNILRHSSNTATAVNVTLTENVDATFDLFQAEDQTGACTITPGGSDTINGNAAPITLNGPRAGVRIFRRSANAYFAYGQFNQDTTLYGDLDANGNAITNAAFRTSQNAQTGTSYTLALADAAKLVTVDNGSANTLTIPTNASVAFANGTTIPVAQIGAGVTTIAGDTGVTVNGVSAGSGDMEKRYGGVTLVKIATDEWLAIGAIGTVA